MASIERVRVALGGFPGAPGVSTFYALDAASMLADLRALYFGRRNDFPGDVTIQFPATGDVVNDTNGQITGTWAGTAPAQVDGLDTGNYAAPVGLTVEWLTASFIAGRRVRGRTFMVPLAGSVFQDDGSVGTTPLGGWRADAATFVTAQSTNLVVWHRPVGGSGGSHALVTLSRVGDKAAVLRSRRD